MEHASARALLAGVVDYAGLFPPAALSMRDALTEYAAARNHPDAWMLGRFVVPAARLPEIASAAAGLSLTNVKLSAIVREASAEDRAAVAAFNAASPHRAAVDAVECKPRALEGVDWLAAIYHPAFEVYVEVAAGGEASGWLERVAACGLRAKIRTGGVTAGAFPPADAVLSFIEGALRLGVRFKATAGLHHAVRGSYALTYETAAAHAPMYGYLNLLLATAALRAGQPADRAALVLGRTDPSSLVFSDTAVRWGEVDVPLEALRATRADHLVSFGSCSFREPVDEFRSLTSR